MQKSLGAVKVVQVKNIKVAEATKIYENIFRSINIALVNEMKYAFNKFDINIDNEEALKLLNKEKKNTLKDHIAVHTGTRTATVVSVENLLPMHIVLKDI